MNLREALQDKLPADILAQTNTRFETIGDIAILEIDEELREYMSIIAQTLVKLHKQIKVVVRKASEHEGELRIQKYEHLAGEKRFETVAKENGIELFLDINKTYYSSKSQNERLRVINQVQPGERVLVMFSGIGPFSIGIAKNTDAKEVVGIELNKDAHTFAEINKEKNNVSHVTNICGDVREVVDTLGVFDRVIMPLPHTAQEFLDEAERALHNSGIIHLYMFATPKEANEYHAPIKQQHRIVDVVSCGTYNPAVNRYCVDIILD